MPVNDCVPLRWVARQILSLLPNSIQQRFHKKRTWKFAAIGIALLFQTVALLVLGLTGVLLGTFLSTLLL